MNDPTRLTPATRALRAKTSAVEEPAEIRLGLQATTLSPTRPTHQTWSDRLGFDMRTHSFWTKLPVPRLTRGNGFDRDLPAGL